MSDRMVGSISDEDGDWGDAQPEAGPKTNVRVTTAVKISCANLEELAGAMDKPSNLKDDLEPTTGGLSGTRGERRKTPDSPYP